MKSHGACVSVLASSDGTLDAVARRPSKARTIKWAIAHLRDGEYYQDLLEGFKRRLQQQSGGKLTIEFVGRPEGGQAENDVKKHSQMIIKQLRDGTADMGQIEAVELGVMAVGAPFLFRSYEHAEAVWGGAVGRKLLKEVAAKTGGKIRGLAFAYSGGYRIMVGQIPIRCAGDFMKVRMRNAGQTELLRELGVDFVKVEQAGMTKIIPQGLFPVGLPMTAKVDLEETEVNRLAYHMTQFPELLKIKYVNLTNHSMLVTSMVVSEDFFASLDADERRLLVEEVEALAVAERKLSVDLAERHLELCAKDGMNVVRLSKAEERTFAAAGEAVCRKHPEVAETLREIKAVKETPRVKTGRREAAAVGVS